MFSETLSPTAVTARVGVEATDRQVKGDLRRRGGRSTPAVRHRWTWAPDDKVERLVDPQLDAIWGALGSRSEAFSALPAEAKVSLSICIVHHGAELSLGWVLDRRHVRTAAAFAASIDVDEYNETGRDA
ncbi:MAG TPA: DUF4279 domain-containing protein [Solirubrobacteraceae bacterium]|nr:DUF4279 domain-containing protein [Solirubrobacteraceae bacterium]